MELSSKMELSEKIVKVQSLTIFAKAPSLIFDRVVNTTLFSISSEQLLHKKMNSTISCPFITPFVEKYLELHDRLE